MHELLDDAAQRAKRFLDGVEERPVAPSDEAVARARHPRYRPTGRADGRGRSPASAGRGRISGHNRVGGAALLWFCHWRYATRGARGQLDGGCVGINARACTWCHRSAPRSNG